MRRAALTATLLATVAGAGMLFGRMTAPRTRGEGPSSCSSGAGDAARDAAGAAAQLDGAMERAAWRAELSGLRDELRAWRATSAGGTASPPPGVAAAAASQASPAPAAPPEQLQLLDHARALLQSATQQHRWRAQDRDRLREVMLGLSGDQRAELTQTFFAALNRGDLHPDLDGPPF